MRYKQINADNRNELKNTSRVYNTNYKGICKIQSEMGLTPFPGLHRTVPGYSRILNTSYGIFIHIATLQ